MKFLLLAGVMTRHRPKPCIRTHGNTCIHEHTRPQQPTRTYMHMQVHRGVHTYAQYTQKPMWSHAHAAWVPRTPGCSDLAGARRIPFCCCSIAGHALRDCALEGTLGVLNCMGTCILSHPGGTGWWGVPSPRCQHGSTLELPWGWDVCVG